MDLYLPLSVNRFCNWNYLSISSHVIYHIFNALSYFILYKDLIIKLNNSIENFSPKKIASCRFFSSSFF